MWADKSDKERSLKTVDVSHLTDAFKPKAIKTNYYGKIDS